MPIAILFDLDDTLFDHSLAARLALTAVHQRYAPFSAQPFAAFARAHAETLEELHADVLAGTRTVDDAREERFRRLFRVAGAPDDHEQVRATAAGYRQGYLEARRPVAGACELLKALKALDPPVRIGIVSNNILEEQEGKVAHCGFTPFLDALVVSEVVGVTKPNPVIFEHALAALDCSAADAVMIGDSWPADIDGARAAGIRAIWFNRTGLAAPHVDPGVTEITALTPTDAIMRVILAEHRCASV
jgi:HAD superfamily hydrolase (TIGR01549 family)